MTLWLSNRLPDATVSRIIKVRDDNGWTPTTADELPKRLMAVVAELREFAEADTPAACEEELADVAIYLITMLHDLSHEFDRATAERSVRTIHWRDSRVDLARRIERYIVMAWEHWRRERATRHADLMICLELALLETVHAALVEKVDFVYAVERKTAVLVRRGNRRGKRADS